MASKYTSKSKSSGLKSAKSVSSSAFSKHYRDTSPDAQSVSISSSVQFEDHQFLSENSYSGVDHPKENVKVAVRFRPLSHKEIRQGDEIAWYADGETIVRNEYNPSVAYAYDRVFAPTTTTRHVYDIVAQHVVGGAMDGINGTIFAYGVTSSGKTHTMHGEQRSPGIIPLAVKDAFGIIQETPDREFLLRVSYLEIYNEVINDLLNPAGQNLRIREDVQGIFVEGIKEEVVLSPAHALSLIAAGEEHRHVGSTNFNLLSSRSHTIFTLTIESSPCGEGIKGVSVNLSQLNLIDLAGSESSRAETTGVRRKEGSYINKSLLTLGSVISKLTDAKTTHIPYRDSKLTRLLQSSLSGHGRISLICTVTPSSNNTEETHNTLKFAHRAKHIEIQTAQNKIVDDKSLIKKYQHEIRTLKEELEHLKKGIGTLPHVKEAKDDNLVLLRQKLEDDQFKMQSRLEQEEEAKAALMGRIHRLTKLILVSTKSSPASKLSQQPLMRRRHSFGEEELAYLPHKRKDLLENENIDMYVSHEGSIYNGNDVLKDDKKNRRQGFLNWLKPRKRDNLGVLTSPNDKLAGPLSTIVTPVDTRIVDFHPDSRLSTSVIPAVFGSDVPEDTNPGIGAHLGGIKVIDSIDLLREQKKILLGEVALHTSTLKRLTEEAVKNPVDQQLHVEVERTSNEIREKCRQVSSLEKEIADSIVSCHGEMNKLEISQSITELVLQLNEKSFQLDIKAADNRIIEEQLLEKTRRCEDLQEMVEDLKGQLTVMIGSNHFDRTPSSVETKRNMSHKNEVLSPPQIYHEELVLDKKEDIKELKEKVKELEKLKQKAESDNSKLISDTSYAKGLASAAAVELKALSGEAAKLMKENERLTAEIETLKSSLSQRRVSGSGKQVRRVSQGGGGSSTVVRRELAVSREREASYEAVICEWEEREVELRRKVEDGAKREACLENELANMWILVAKLKKLCGEDVGEDYASTPPPPPLDDMFFCEENHALL